MREKRTIATNCEKATFMIEKKILGAISSAENLELKIHLASCEPCRIFQMQSKMIDKVAGNIFIKVLQKELQLDEKYKKELQQRIDKKSETIIN